MFYYPEDELISTFHKLLRRENISLACYFAKRIKEQIGLWRVKQYMFYVCFEETYNLNLYKEIEMFYSKPDEETTDLDLYKLVATFVKSNKKWETEIGQEFYMVHLEADKKLKEDFIGTLKRYSVKNIELYYKWRDLLIQDKNCYSTKKKVFKKIGEYDIPEILSLLEESLKEKDLEKTIYLSIHIYRNKDKFPFKYLKVFFESDFSKQLYSIMEKYNGKYTYSYNYILLFLSEYIDIPLENLYEISEINLIKLKEDIDTKLSSKSHLQIPLYALDNHTKRGKQLLKQYGVFRNTPSPYVDMRLSGHWIGVIWRIEAMKQYGTIKKKWEEVNIEKKQLEGLNYPWM